MIGAVRGKAPSIRQGFNGPMQADMPTNRFQMLANDFSRIVIAKNLLRSAIEKIKVSKFESYSLPLFSDKFVRTLHVLKNVYSI